MEGWGAGETRDVWDDVVVEIAFSSDPRGWSGLGWPWGVRAIVHTACVGHGHFMSFAM